MSQNTALALTDDQTEFNEAQIATLQQLGLRNAARGDLAVLFHTARRTGLDPFARQIYMIERQGKQTIQTGIDGLRLVAQRTSERTRQPLGYEDTVWCGPDGQWVDVWLSQEPPAAAKVTVTRGASRFPAVALFAEYAARKRDGSLTSMWASKPALMLAKCAEALALRKAFPQDLSGLYTADEMGQADGPHQPAPQQQQQRAPSPAMPATDDPDRKHRLAMWRELEAQTVPAEHRLATVAGLVGRELSGWGDVTEEDAELVVEKLSADVAPGPDGGDGDKEDDALEGEVIDGGE